jgi:hypothetical protein
MENQDHDWIKLNMQGNKHEAVEHSCSCKACKGMCKKTPCLGTPSDILKIIEAGYKKEIASTYWAAGVVHGQGPIEMFQPFQNKNGRCVFLDCNDLCKLHDKGLKPIEGRLASHKQKGTPLAFFVARTWLFKRNDETILKIMQSLYPEIMNKI